ncbi:MAG TPA: response regulator [Tepidisphaeraceae bacterium]|jgi:HD-like signal output (HDOD) protein/ActR/RegA family two-component response regulator|nr:response regulator [Tepidisphaeraceae bacterium]
MTDNSPSSKKTQPLILVVDDQAIIREPIAARLTAEGYRTIQADNGHSAIALMRQHRPELVLLDVAMPKMSGLTVLQLIRQDSTLASVPVIMLTAIKDRRVLTNAAQLGVRDYLLKTNFSLSEMLARVAKYLPVPSSSASGGASSVNPSRPAAKESGADANGASDPKVLLTRDQCLVRVEKALEGRSLSGIVSEVLSLVNSPRSALADLASVIGRDPALTARVLHTANSAAFRGARKMVTTLPDAVKQLGCGNIRNIAMTLGIVEVMPAGQSEGFDPIRSWQHSFAVALLSEHLCVASGDENNSAIVYVVGLCHDLGEILFRTEFGREYSQILQAANPGSVSIDELERQMIGITQGELAAIILKKLGLPDNIRHPIEQFHASQNNATRPMSDRLARVLQKADLFANGMMMAGSVASPVAPLTKAAFREIFKKDDPSVPDVDAIRAQILALTGMLANLPAADEAKLMQPLLKPTRKRALYIRDHVFSAFDPMATVLKLLASVTTFAKLPEKIDSATYDAVVLARAQPPPQDIKTPVLHINPEMTTEPASSGLVTSVAAISLESLAKFLTDSTATARAAA